MDNVSIINVKYHKEGSRDQKFTHYVNLLIRI